MSAYVIYHYNITDRSRIDQLTERSLPVNEKYGATVIVGSPVKALKGRTHSHLVILQFENFASAEKYYTSEEHIALSLFMDEVTDGWSSIVPGDSETQELVGSGYFSLSEKVSKS